MHGALQRLVLPIPHAEIWKLSAAIGDAGPTGAELTMKFKGNATLKAMLADIGQDCTSVRKHVVSAGVEADGAHRVEAGPGPILYRGLDQAAEVDLALKRSKDDPGRIKSGFVAM